MNKRTVIPATELAQRYIQKKPVKSEPEQPPIDPTDEEQVNIAQGNYVDTTDYLLSPQQKLSAILAGRGLRQVDIAKQMGVQTATVARWAKLPHWQLLRDSIQNKLANEPAIALTPLLPKAVRAMDEVLEDTDKKRMKLRLEAAKDIMDRQYGKAVTRQVSQNVSDVHIHFHEKEVEIGKYIVQDMEE